MSISKRHALHWTLTLGLLPLTVAVGQDSADNELSSPLDELRPENIPEYERRVAAERNGGTLPEGLVAILGDSRWQHPGVVRDIAVLPDGKLCLMASDRALILWDLRNGEAVRVLRHPSGLRLQSCARSTDGSLLAAGTLGGEAFLWEMPDGALHHQFTADGGNVALSGDGSLLATASATEINLWEVHRDGVRRRREPLPTAEIELQGLLLGAEHAAVNAGGTQLATTHWVVRRVAGQLQPNATRIVLWNARTGAPQRTLDGHETRRVTEVVFSPDGCWLASSGEDGHVKLWNAADGDLVWDYQTANGRWVHDISFSSGGQFVWALVNEALVPIDVRNGRAGWPVAVPVGATCFSFLPDGTHVALALDGPRIVDLATGALTPRPKPETHEGPILALQFGAEDRQLATAGADGQVVLWDLPAGRLHHRLVPHAAPIWTLGYTRDGSLLVSADEQGELRFWEPATGRLIASKAGPNMPNSLVFDNAGRFLAVGGAASPLQVWDLVDWRQLCPGGRTLRGVRCLALLPQERVLITTDGLIDLDRYEYAAAHDRDGALEAISQDMVRALWGRKLGYLSAEETIAELNISEGSFAAAFCPKGTQIAVMTENPETERAELNVLDARSGAALWSTDRFDQDVMQGAFAFSRDGRYLAYPAGNGTVHIIRIPLPPPQPE